MIPKKQRGTHTWDMNCRYHRCPKCGTIIESRDAFEYRLGKWLKQLKCDKCDHEFTDERKPNAIGPIFGK